jgi:hypothetical protein
MQEIEEDETKKAQCFCQCCCVCVCKRGQNRKERWQCKNNTEISSCDGFEAVAREKNRVISISLN